jgi:(p)ppGpp synthase/HD superfamily hydrolase
MSDADALGRLLDALDFAAERHVQQRRKGHESVPYINHPIRVARILAGADVHDPEILMAALLHDTIEDTSTTADELSERFGGRVAHFVEEVSDDKTLRKSERWQRQIERAPGLSEGARQIKIADKLANIADIAEAPPRDWTIERRVQYLDWADRVVHGCVGVNPKLDAMWPVMLEEARAHVGAAR